MALFSRQTKQKSGSFIYSPPLPPTTSTSNPHYRVDYEKESPKSSTFNKISPVLVLTIIILAIIFFVFGLLHLLFRFLIKRPSLSPIYQSNRYPETSGSHSIHRQLQQLFRLHDSGLDQAFIDALPVFYYKDIMGLKEPFDCAVCLCEFSDRDKLRLLPMCSHAFHIDCIDTWLLSNSTCPLCRGNLLNSGPRPENPVFGFDDSGEQSNGFSADGEDRSYCSQKPVEMAQNVGRVFSVRLGKFRSINDGESSRSNSRERGEAEISSSSSSNLDPRRCYSMGTFQYVVGDSDLQVALSRDGLSKSVDSRGVENGCCSVDKDVEEKRISRRAKGESFSVSKIWLWPKKGKFPSSSNYHVTTVNFHIDDRT